MAALLSGGGGDEPTTNGTMTLGYERDDASITLTATSSPRPPDATQFVDLNKWAIATLANSLSGSEGRGAVAAGVGSTYFRSTPPLVLSTGAAH